MSHITSQDELVLASLLDLLLEGGGRKGAWVVLGDDNLAILWSQLLKLGGERGVWSEDWGTGWDGVDDVNDGALGGAVLLEEGGDSWAGAGDVLGLEVAVGVPGRS